MTPPSSCGSGESTGSHQGIPATSVPWQTTVWPGHIRPVITAAGLARARGLPGCLWKGNLTLLLTGQSAELPVSAEAGSEVSWQARRGRLQNWGPGQVLRALP